MAETKPKVMIAMSGGVDSTMAAVMLVDQGYDVIGGTLELADTDRCCLIFEASSTCKDLGIPYHVIDAKEMFEQRIIGQYLSEIQAGRTPSPCITCNAVMKFGHLLDKARELGCEYIATGHYSQVVEHKGRLVIKKGIDPGKDQSYFLFELSQDQLAHTLFPLGKMTKPQVRAWCRERQFPAAEQGDSQDLCFVPRSGPQDFLRERLPEMGKEGNIVNQAGEVLGTHPGVFLYTIGQRKGIGLHGGPWYVVQLRVASNEVVVARRDEVNRREMTLSDVNWMIKPPTEPLRCRVRVRYNHRESAAVVTVTGERTAEVLFDEAQFAITPGQGAAFYEDDLVIGGGWID